MRFKLPQWKFPFVVNGTLDIEEFDDLYETMSPTELYDAWRILHARVAADCRSEYGSWHWGPYGPTVDYWMQFQHPIGICQRCNESSRIVNDNMSKTRMHMGGAKTYP